MPYYPFGTPTNCRVIVDGQSLNVYGASPWPDRVDRGQAMIVANQAISGKGWFELVNSLTPRLSSVMDQSSRGVVLVMLGGSADIWSDHTGAQAYTDEVTYVTNVKALATARSLGIRIVGTTTTPATLFTTAENTELLNLNTAVRNDASAAFDVKVDLWSDPRLNNPNDTTYYADGIHPTNNGIVAITELMRPGILTCMRQLGASV